MNASKHGVTGMALSSEEVQAFMDYLEDAIPVKGKINKDGKKSSRSNFMLQF